jgi:hypothetical protein
MLCLGAIQSRWLNIGLLGFGVHLASQARPFRETLSWGETESHRALRTIQVPINKHFVIAPIGTLRLCRCLQQWTSRPPSSKPRFLEVATILARIPVVPFALVAVLFQ